jgi:hypothetical protein
MRLHVLHPYWYQNSNVLFVFKVRSLATHLAGSQYCTVSHAIRLKYTYWDRLEALHYHKENTTSCTCNIFNI